MKKHGHLALMVLAILASPVAACDALAFLGDDAATTPDADDKDVIACQLGGDELAERTSEIMTWLAMHEETREHADGYAMRFPGNEEWTERLMDFVKTERGCCSFFKFELSFEADQGPIWLYVGGSAEAKAFIESMLE